jgi:hypothetical protein
MKKTYQIDKQRAAQQFRSKAGASQQQIQFALPLPEILGLAQQGLMNLALAAFIGLAEAMMRWEVTDLVGPKSQANEERENSRWGAQTGYCVVGPEGSVAASAGARRATRKCRWAATRCCNKLR